MINENPNDHVKPNLRLKNCVEVERTTSEALNTMVKCIYKLPGNGGDTFNLNVECLQKLLELLDLAERYEIQNLATMASDALETLTINTRKHDLHSNCSKELQDGF